MDLHIVETSGAYGILKRLGRTVSYDLYLSRRYYSTTEFDSEEAARDTFDRAVQTAKEFKGIPFGYNLIR